MPRFLTPVLKAALLAAAPLAVTAAAPLGARVRNDVPPATPTGPPRACVQIRDFNETRVRNDRVIDFMTGRYTAYRVTLPDDCPSLGLDRAFLYKTSISQLCQQDFITVLRTGPYLTRGASCGLAPFQPVSLPRRR